MGVAFVALKKGRGQGGFEGASPHGAVTEKPTQPPAFFQCNPTGCKCLGRLSALLARARPLRVLPLRSRLEIRPKHLQQRLPPFIQWFLSLLAYLGLLCPLHAQSGDGDGKALDFRGIQIDKEKRTITFPAAINMTQGMLEYLIVAETGKTHESLLSTKIQPYDIQVAMLLLGIAPAGKADAQPPAQINKAYLKTAPELKGEKISIFLAWQDARGGHRVRAEEMIWNLEKNAPMAGGPWTYTGSLMYGGKFLAQIDGSVAALVRDSAALMNNPRPGNDDDQIWEAYTQVTPAAGTAVDVIVKLEDNPVK